MWTHVGPSVLFKPKGSRSLVHGHTCTGKRSRRIARLLVQPAGGHHALAGTTSTFRLGL